MTRLFAILTLILLVHDVAASGHPTEELQLQRAAEEAKEGRLLVEQFFLNADMVFVGRLISERKTERVQLNAEGEEQRFETTYVRFTPLKVFKGSPSPETEYYFEELLGLMTFQGGYSSLAGTDDVGFNEGPGYRFIVYTIDGEIVRSNPVRDWFDGLTSEVELGIIQEATEK